MVAYAPPDRVLITLGASVRTEAILSVATRLGALVLRDISQLGPFGLSADLSSALAREIKDLSEIWRDPRAKKHDTPLQMAEIIEVMGRARAWLRSLRVIASINLSLDTPALTRLVSSAPEVFEGYGRDLLKDLEARIHAARELKPRIEEAGLTDAFVARGQFLARQLATAMGPQDLDPGNLHFVVRRLYMRKGALYLLLKRIERAGQLAFMEMASRATLYHLREIEPEFVEPVFRSSAKSSR